MLSRLLPAGVIAVDAVAPFAELVIAATDSLPGAVPARREEFARGRACARQALVNLGASEHSVARGPTREPLWPAGVVGSITHCTDYVAAVVAWRRAVASIGIDAEPNQPLPDGVVATIAFGDERSWLAQNPSRGIPWDRVLFAAKESVYKAWFPLAQRWLGFEDATIVIEPDRDQFHAIIHVAGSLTRVDGRYAIDRGRVLTVASIPSPL